MTLNVNMALTESYYVLEMRRMTPPLLKDLRLKLLVGWINKCWHSEPPCGFDQVCLESILQQNQIWKLTDWNVHMFTSVWNTGKSNETMCSLCFSKSSFICHLQNHTFVFANSSPVFSNVAFFCNRQLARRPHSIDDTCLCLLWVEQAIYYRHMVGHNRYSLIIFVSRPHQCLVIY